MELQQIRYFIAVSRRLNFTKAAEDCNVTQPSLTRGIRRLESSLGGLLIDRLPGHVRLTELGQSLLPRLEEALSILCAVTNNAHGRKGPVQHKLRMGLACTLGPPSLVGAIARFLHARQDIELAITEAASSDIVEQLLGSEVDVAVACQPNYSPEIDAVELKRERFLLAFPAGHKFGSLDAVALDDVAEEPYLERIKCEFDDYYALAGRRPLSFDIRFSSDREDWVQAMILAGLGVALVPEGLPLMPGILTRPVVDPPVMRSISLLTHRRRSNGSAVTAIVDSILESFPDVDAVAAG